MTVASSRKFHLIYMLERYLNKLLRLLRRIRRSMFNFVDNYAPNMNQYFRRNEEEEALEIETRRRIIFPNEERIQLHIHYMRQMERENRKSAPPIPSHTGKKINPTQEYKDFVMYKDLESLINLKKIREQEEEMNQKIVESRKELNQIVAEINLQRELGNDEDEKSDDEPMPNDPLLPQNQQEISNPQQ